MELFTDLRAKLIVAAIYATWIAASYIVLSLLFGAIRGVWHALG